MIKFNKSSTNKVIVTLNENSISELIWGESNLEIWGTQTFQNWGESSITINPIYLFKFVSQQTLVSYYFIATDISTHKIRYNRFTVTEKANADTLNGEVSLGKEGYYDYKVYQTNLTDTIGLADAEAAIPNIIKEVEDGLVYVVFAANTDITYTEIDNTTVVYQP